IGGIRRGGAWRDCRDVPWRDLDTGRHGRKHVRKGRSVGKARYRGQSEKRGRAVIQQGPPILVRLWRVVEDPGAGANDRALILAETVRQREPWCEVVRVRADVLREREGRVLVGMRLLVDVVPEIVNEREA